MAAACGTSAATMVQPLSAPIPETITTAAMTSPHAVPPNIELTTAEKGAVASASSAAGRIPKTAISDSM